MKRRCDQSYVTHDHAVSCAVDRVWVWFVCRDWSQSSSELITHRAISQSLGQYTTAGGHLFSRCEAVWGAFCVWVLNVSHIMHLNFLLFQPKLKYESLSLCFDVHNFFLPLNAHMSLHNWHQWWPDTPPKSWQCPQQPLLQSESWARVPSQL